MEKNKTIFYCQKCGAEYSKWMGKCSSCGEWNTIVEEIQSKKAIKKNWRNEKKQATKPVQLNKVSLKNEQRVITTNGEFNRVIGGGIVPGSVLLIGGEPGIGKSTLLLQIAISTNSIKTLYVTGEESERQIKLRSERLDNSNNNCYVLTETNIQNIFIQIKNLNPSLLIIDSIQTLNSNSIESGAGSVSQIRECTAELIRFAKESNTPVVIVGHITKDGQIAGPKILEHMVDTVLQFEGDRNHAYRIVRCIKNRYGNTAEIAVYEMQSNGLIEVKNPSDVLITKKEEHYSGIAITSTLEGIRPIMIEVQALVSNAVYGTPQRAITGYDTKRLNMLLAVLEKRCGFKLGSKDVFVNITGGLKVSTTSIDLGIVIAILSSIKNQPISDTYCFASEIGLTGDIRPIPRINQIITEAEKMGYKKIFISKYSKLAKKPKNIQIQKVSGIVQLYKILF